MGSPATAEPSTSWTLAFTLRPFRCLLAHKCSEDKDLHCFEPVWSLAQSKESRQQCF